VFNDLGLTKDVINVPGCPPHPDWVLLTIADILAGSPVEVDSYCRPAAFFSSRPLHDSCLRRGSFDSLQRGERLADGECTYGLGCKGTLSFADCPSRKWNGGVSMCTQAGGLCIACVEPEFPDAFSPFFSKIESREIISGLSLDTAAEIVIGAAALGAGLHAVKRLAVGESGREDMEVPEKKKKDKEGRIRRL
jgi:hydrogenase small subunit